MPKARKEKKMKITDLLDEKSIKLNAKSNNKKDALNQIINLINQTGNITNKEEYQNIVFKREEQGKVAWKTVG